MARLGAVATGARALGGAVRGVAEVFVPNATRALEFGHDAYRIAHETHGAEFRHIREGRFDRFVNGLNRLPRPLLALGTLGLFVYAMTEPVGFAQRMQALGHVPEPLWWLLGAVVAFYFGAREAHHLRCAKGSFPAATPAPRASPTKEPPAMDNPALKEWQGR